MKQVLCFILLSLSILPARSQNLELHYGISPYGANFLYGNFNIFKTDKLGSTYLSADAFFLGNEVRHNNKIYFELERVFTFKKGGHWGAVIEFQGGLGRLAEGKSFAINNSYLGGPSFTWDRKDGHAGFCAFAQYRYVYLADQPHNAQVSLSWYVKMLKERLVFKGYFDLFSDRNEWSNVNFCSEPQLWWMFFPNFGVGTEVRLFYDMGHPGFTVIPTVALKWSF